MVKKIKWLFFLSVLTVLFSSCLAHKGSVEGYRYVSFENVPRDKTGRLSGKPIWGKSPNYISSVRADSFFIYPNFDSIRVVYPNEHFGLFTKTSIKTKRWKAKSKYGKMHFVGNYIADHLPGTYMSFYVTKDRSSIMQVSYSNPGNLIDAILFHKNAENILEKQGIIIDAKDEDSEPVELDISF